MIISDSNVDGSAELESEDPMQPGRVLGPPVYRLVHVLEVTNTSSSSVSAQPLFTSYSDHIKTRNFELKEYDQL